MKGALPRSYGSSMYGGGGGVIETLLIIVLPRQSLLLKRKNELDCKKKRYPNYLIAHKNIFLFIFEEFAVCLTN